MGKQRYTIDEAWVQRYREGTLSEEEQAWLRDHPFEAEALEGLAGRPQWSQDMAGLQQRLRERSTKPASRWPAYMRYAASLALLVTVGWFTYRYAIQEEAKDSPVSIVQQEEVMAAESLMQPPSAPDKVSGEAAQPLASRMPIAQSQPSVEAVPVPEPDSEPQPSAASSPVLEERTALADEAENREQSDAEAGDYTLSSPALSRKMSGFEAKARSASPPEQFGHHIAGSVFSADDRVPLPGVNVMVKGTLVGTVTDTDGYFSVPVTDSSQTTLVFSTIGFAPEEIAVDHDDSLTVMLEQDVQSLAEVVVTRSSPQSDATLHTAYPVPSRKAFREYVREQLRYPEAAQQQGIEGTVKVGFTVEADGSLSDFRIEKSLGYGCDEEAIRLIKEGPNWQPAIQSGRTQSQEMTVKIRFKQ